jgi:cation diffusion facilitator CzcD-associated flavoprotein CzcO
MGHCCHFLNKDWLSKHKIPIDCAKTSFKLTTSDRNELEYIAKFVVIAKGAAHHVKLNQ